MERNFCAIGYFVDTVGRNEKTIKNRSEEDYVIDQIALNEYIDLLRVVEGNRTKNRQSFK